MPTKISAYAAKAKTRFRYSELYQRWEAAKRRGENALAKTLGAEHTARFIGDPRANLAAWRQANRPARNARKGRR